MKKMFKEPLLHFMAIGSLVFLLFSAVNPGESAKDGQKIIVSTGDIERLSTNWAKKWNRAPTVKELNALIDSYIREEVYYREALALGLDQDDAILRRRLMQKMEFLSNDIADLSNPDETALNDYFRENKDKYELPSRISFTHIYFSADKHGNHLFDDAGKILADIRSSSPTTSSTADRGDAFMLQYEYTLETPFEVARLFGQSFSEQLFQLDTGDWQGPIESGYGLHLVLINELIDAKLPDLAAVIDKVRTDWMYEQRQKTNKAIYERFKARYEVVIENRQDNPGTKRESRSAS